MAGNFRYYLSIYGRFRLGENAKNLVGTSQLFFFLVFVADIPALFRVCLCFDVLCFPCFWCFVGKNSLSCVCFCKGGYDFRVFTPMYDHISIYIFWASKKWEHFLLLFFCYHPGALTFFFVTPLGCWWVYFLFVPPTRKSHQHPRKTNNKHKKTTPPPKKNKTKTIIDKQKNKKTKTKNK